MSILDRIPILRDRSTALARNTGWMLAGEIARVVIQAVYFFAVARSLNTEGYGAFASIAALAAVLSPFSGWGWGNLLIKYVSRDRDEFRAYWAQALTITTASGMILTILTTIVALLIFRGEVTVALPLSLCIAELIANRLVVTSGQAYQAHQRLQRTALMQLLLSAIRLVAAGAMIAFIPAATATQWAVLYCVSTVAVAIFAVLLATRELGRPLFKRGIRNGDVSEGFHFAVLLSSQTIYNDIDKTMLGKLGGFGPAGVYAAAYRIIDVAFSPIRSLLAAALPRFFQAGAGGMPSTVAFAKRLVAPGAAYAVVAGIGLVVTAPIAGWLLGPDYADTVDAVRFLAVIPFLRTLSILASDSLGGAGYQHWRSSVQFAVALLNIALNFVLIPRYSWRGAAISSLVTDSLLVVGTWVLAWIALRRELRAQAGPTTP